MSDIFEALLGAIFLDNQMDTRPIRSILLKHLIPRLDPQVDYARKRPVMEKIIYEVQTSGCKETHLRRCDYPLRRTFDHRIVHKHLANERSFILVLCIHGIDFCTVQATSQNLAKMQLAESIQGQFEQFKASLRRLCTCVMPNKCARDGVATG